MMLASYTVLPQSVLAPSQLYDKFNHVTMSGLRGLSCGCSQFDEGGDCLDPDPCSTGGSAPIISTTGGFTNDITSAATCASFGSGYNAATNQCTFASGNNSGTGSSSPSTTLTTQQQALLGSQITTGAFDIAKLLAIQPGTTLTASGAISQQSAGYPINSTGLSTSLSTSGISSTTLLMLAAVATVFLFGMEGGR